uniref:Methyltransferase domain-containing protein n=1 Tax=Nothoprocta perdicaria TaxID=30464 RepID=A0A8C7EFW1_NOTPE
TKQCFSLETEGAKSGYTDLTGIDYSPSAIQLSEQVKEKEGMSNIKFQVEDFLAPSAGLSGFEICIDKGTFDAVSLNPEDAVGKRKQYVRSLCNVLKPGVQSNNTVLQTYKVTDLQVFQTNKEWFAKGYPRGE